jgi:hypothetical protein
MDWNAQVGQMAQIDMIMLLNDDKTTLRQDLLDHYIATLGVVGIVLNNDADPTICLGAFVTFGRPSSKSKQPPRNLNDRP